MRRPTSRRGRRLAALAAIVSTAGMAALTAGAQLPSTTDPRANLAAGFENPGVAFNGVALLANRAKPAAFSNPANPGDFGLLNSDLALQGNHAFVGNFNGFNIYDISNPSSPTLTTSVVCPGGQGDLSVYGNLLFMSVEETRAKIDCTLTPPATALTRFRGVRIFDISNIASPVQVGGVQTCRGSHTHTLVTDEDDPNNVYIYVSGTGNPRAASELAGCGNPPATDPNATRWRIEIIKVPLAAPQTAAIVNMPRLFTDPATGAIDGLQNNLPTPQHPSGINWQPQPTTDSCHDITVFSALDLAAGACEGNGLLLDISDPANPVRIDAVADPLWAYWHGATFSNDGTKVIFTDEWGGGTNPRCRATDQLPWGANAIYEIVDRKLVFRSYYKLPVAQVNQENCVSHIPSLVPVPGRDVFVQAWYQGGVSLVDFTNPASPVEIGYFDRGPVSSAGLVFGGLWATYWYNGATYGSELARGFDVYGLTETAALTENEIAAAKTVTSERMNAQNQEQFGFPPSFALARAYLDQLIRADDIDAKTLDQATKFIDRAEQFSTGPQAAAAKAQLHAFAQQLKHEEKYASLVEALEALAGK
jgi:hypothetical protein